MVVGICDDNLLFLDYITSMIKDFYAPYDNIQVTSLLPGQLTSELESKTFQYDLLVTDIEMGPYNGIDLAKEINASYCCSIIFISNYINYAPEVYDTNHIYFVLKDDLVNKLPKALTLALEQYKDHQQKVLQIKYHGVEYRIPQDEITHIEIRQRNLFTYSIKGTYQCIETLKSVEPRLAPYFARCHKSYIVNMNYIRSISRTSCTLLDKEIPISLTYSKSFHDQYLNYIASRI